MKSALVCGAGGFIGGHLVKRLKKDGFWVRGVDLKFHEYSETEADDFVVGDLRDQAFCRGVVDRRFDEVYQLAADMGGAGYIFTGDHDADVMHNSATINLNVLDACHKRTIQKIFYSSSACMYPATIRKIRKIQNAPRNSRLSGGSPTASTVGKSCSANACIWLTRETTAWKCALHATIIFLGRRGPGTGGREKAPAAICRKIAQARTAARSRCGATASRRALSSISTSASREPCDCCGQTSTGPVNIGSEEMVTINQLASFVGDIAGKRIGKNHVPGPQGVRGRNSDNRLIREKLGWEPGRSLRAGLEPTYQWIDAQVNRNSTPNIRAA